MLIDTNTFIKAVEARPCLWNVSDKDYSDKYAKQESWYEIGKLSFEGWPDLSSEEKDAKVICLQKKWKSIRDYYMRTVKKHERDKSGRLERKRKKNLYFINLEFLDITRKARRESTHLSDGNFIYLDETHVEDNVGVDSDSSLSVLNTASTSNPETPEKKPKLREIIERESQLSNVSDNRDEDSNRYFLLSLLPDMVRMSERQNFTFRMEIMKALDRVKYRSKGSESS